VVKLLPWGSLTLGKLDLAGDLVGRGRPKASGGESKREAKAQAQGNRCFSATDSNDAGENWDSLRVLDEGSQGLGEAWLQGLRRGLVTVGTK
jgi:hypothetical protein